MYDFLTQHCTRPEPHSVYTAEELWTDPHVASQMLALHLDREGDIASRNHAAIERIVRWIVRRFDLSSGRRVLDLGCGPGLYSSLLFSAGAEVTGVDFSESSLAYAREAVPVGEAGPMYIQANYLDLKVDETFDLALLIYGDLCALSPSQRRHLLASIQEWLAPGGHLAFDVFSTALFDELGEEAQYTFEGKGGFWSPKSHFHFQRRFKFANALYLDRHAVVAADSTREVLNWMQCYSPETLSQELQECGWRAVEVVGSLAGDPYEPSSHSFAVIAEPQ
ncbi:MAG: class I SAM-dependent methyltransferase [Gemmatimonadota bacterium]|jgi:SAM-dependent methyltransferase